MARIWTITLFAFSGLVSAEPVAKPQSAYFLWAAENRERIQKALGTKLVKEVQTKLGEEWKAVSEAEKAKFESVHVKQKAAYETFLKTAEGKQFASEQKTARADKKIKKAKKSAKAVPKDDKLKRPPSAYFIWLADNRERLAKAVGAGAKASEVTKKAGDEWKALAEKDKKPYEEKAAKAKKEHDDYVASDAGKKVLAEYKGAVQDVKTAAAPGAEKLKEKKAKKVAKKAAKKEKLLKKMEKKEKPPSKKKQTIEDKETDEKMEALLKKKNTGAELTQTFSNIISRATAVVIGFFVGSGFTLILFGCSRGVPTSQMEPLLDSEA